MRLLTTFRCRAGALAGLATFGFPCSLKAQAPPPVVIASIELSKPFAIAFPCRLIVTEASPTSGADTVHDAAAPGPVRLCLTKGRGEACNSEVEGMPHPPPPLTDADWEPHYLLQARVVQTARPPIRPLLLLQTGSLFSGDGDQARFTQLLAYGTGDRFTQVYAHATLRNNNQEVRYIGSGPLAGSVAAAEPTDDAPFAYWITIDAPDSAGSFKQRLRYRSATLYGDGNRLAVIDSEMANIGVRLEFWHFGRKLPVPVSCLQPKLIHSEIWCK